MDFLLFLFALPSFRPHLTFLTPSPSPPHSPWLWLPIFEIGLENRFLFPIVHGRGGIIMPLTVYIFIWPSFLPCSSLFSFFLGFHSFSFFQFFIFVYFSFFSSFSSFSFYLSLPFHTSPPHALHAEKERKHAAFCLHEVRKHSNLIIINLEGRQQIKIIII